MSGGTVSGYRLHQWFGVYWALWMAALGTGFVWWAGSLAGELEPLPWKLYALHLALFFPPEGLAVWLGGDLAATLSGFWHWVGARTPIEYGWYRAWNATVVMAVLLVAWEVGYVTSGAGAALWIGVPLALLTAGFLFYHWLRPEKYA